MTSVAVPVRDADGQEVGQIEVAQLPGRADRLERDADRVILEEEGTYRFRVNWLRESLLQIEPGDELFSFDDETRRAGRLRPRQHVGRIRVSVADSETTGGFVLRVEPRKLDAETEYHQMLEDIARVAAEATLQGFAPAALSLSHQPGADPKLLYQQFAFIHARLSGSGSTDFALVLNQPHRGWIEHEEPRLPGTPMRGGSRNIRALTRYGARVPAPTAYGIATIPRRPTVAVTDETLDTEANRFIKFALERWRGIAVEVQRRLSTLSRRTGPMSRGFDATEEVISLADGLLRAPLFREVGHLQAFPTGNTVLQKRSGYRDIFRTFVLAETGARLALEWDIEDVFSASQRNVATLYEYWAFLQLADAVGTVCGDDHAPNALVPSSNGLSLGFPSGHNSKLRWTLAAGGRDMEIQLFFNRSFAAGEWDDASWTRAMRPDCSVLIRPSSSFSRVSSDELSMWLHFDAKYKIERLREQFSRPGLDDAEAAVEAEEAERVGQSTREDLLKMHAYRDAIRRSAGAYVLFPGEGKHVTFSEYRELLPGLGAFPLRPAQGRASGLRQLESFLLQVIDHAADRASRHERGRYWGIVINRDDEPRGVGGRRVPELSAPPSDAAVLCGFVRDKAHQRWIERTGLYNVRAGDRRGAVGADATALHPTDIVLYGPETVTQLWHRSGPWFIQQSTDLMVLGYPGPRGRSYLVCPLEIALSPEWLASIRIDQLSKGVTVRGAPFVTTWSALLDG